MYAENFKFPMPMISNHDDDDDDDVQTSKYILQRQCNGFIAHKNVVPQN